MFEIWDAVISTVIVILGLVWIYKNREQEERNLGWKIVGYYFLGSFRLNLGSIPIPAGFIYFWMYFPKRIPANVHAKKRAVWLGLLAIAANIVINFGYTWYEQKNETVKATSINAYQMNFLKDFQRVQTVLRANQGQGDHKINDFLLSYDKKGNVQMYSYKMLFYRGDKQMMAYVTYSEGFFRISPALTDQSNAGSLTDIGWVDKPEDYFNAMDKFGLKKLEPKGKSFTIEWTQGEQEDENNTVNSRMILSKKGIYKASKNDSYITNIRVISDRGTISNYQLGWW